MRAPLAPVVLAFAFVGCGARSSLRDEALGADVPLAARDAAPADAPRDVDAGPPGMPGRPCACAFCSAECIGAPAGCPDGVPCVRAGGRVVQQCAQRCGGPGSLCWGTAVCVPTMLCDSPIFVCAEP